MKISKEETRKIADLAHLDLDPEVLNQTALQLGRILEYVEILREADTSGVEPTAHALDLKSVTREDKVEPMEYDKEALFGNAPRFENGFFIVPKVME